MAAVALMGSLGSLGVVSASASAVVVNAVYVSTTGNDTNSCATPALACATINHAIDVAVPGDTVKVAAGTYHQTVDVTKAVAVVGAGAASTTIDGTGLDPNDVPATAGTYGVVYVGTTGGASSVSGFTITNPDEFSYTGGEPEVVALKDQSSSDSVVITKNILSMGAATANASTDFPIGLDSFVNSATTTISHNTIEGTFQGALLEDNGPVSFSHNKVKNLISNTYTDNSNFPATPTVYTYAPEGLFFVSDTSGSLTGQDATNNRFSHIAGYGIIMEAGYDNGNCNTCHGSIAGMINSNHFALQGGSDTVTGPNPPTSSAAAAITLQAEFSGDNLTATVDNNRGFVHSPDAAMNQSSTNGATISVSQAGNNIHVRP